MVLWITALRTKNNSTVHEYEKTIISKLVNSGFEVSSASSVASLFKEHSPSFTMALKLNKTIDISRSSVLDFLMDICTQNNIKYYSIILSDKNGSDWIPSNIDIEAIKKPNKPNKSNHLKLIK